MRNLASDPEALRKVTERAKNDPEFWLRIFEHGFGRPPQAIDVRGSLTDPSEQHIYRAVLSDGVAFSEDPDPATAPVLPAEARS